MFWFIVSKEIIGFWVKFIIKIGNFFKKKKCIKYHRKFKKLDIKPFFQKGNIQLFSIFKFLFIKTPKLFIFNNSLKILIVFIWIFLLIRKSNLNMKILNLKNLI